MGTRQVLGWLTLSAVVIGACGDGDGGALSEIDPTTTTIAAAPGSTTASSTAPASSGPPASTPGAAATTTTTTSLGPQDPAKLVLAKAATLQIADLGAPWQAKPEEERLDHETTWVELTACLGVPDSGQGQARAVSPTFTKGVATQATGAVELVPAGAAQRIATAFAGPKALGCAKDALTSDVRRNTPPGATIGTVEVTPGDVSGLGQLTVAYRSVTPIDLGFPIQVFQDHVIVFKGDAVTRVTFLNPGGSIPVDEQRMIVEKVVART